jgi:hypothetical protein
MVRAVLDEKAIACHLGLVAMNLFTLRTKRAFLAIELGRKNGNPCVDGVQG